MKCNYFAQIKKNDKPFFIAIPHALLLISISGYIGNANCVYFVNKSDYSFYQVKQIMCIDRMPDASSHMTFVGPFKTHESISTFGLIRYFVFVCVSSTFDSARHFNTRNPFSCV